MHSYKTTEHEVEFDFDELFFSRTDERGKIMSGNAVFQRVSGYTWTELLGKPHNIIRHPDVPRGVFWLLWDQIRKGAPIGAYVKNRSKDGRYYWVYAIVTPVEGGYLSVRLKPSSRLFGAVRNEYARLLQLETDTKLSPEQSGQAILARLQELGFETYQSFMAAGLLSEIAGRTAALGHTPEPTTRLFEELLAASAKLLHTASGISDAFQDYRFVPLNLVVQAGRLGDAGAAIGTISNNYAMLSQEIKAGLETFSEGARQVSETISEGAFLIATASIQKEIARVFERETATLEIDHAAELVLLDEQQERYYGHAIESLVDIQRRLEGFVRGTADLKRLTSGLGAIRVMGKVEAGRLGTGVLNDLISDLEAFQSVLNKGLSEIGHLNHTLQSDVVGLVKAYSMIEAH